MARTFGNAQSNYFKLVRGGANYKPLLFSRAGQPVSCSILFKPSLLNERQGFLNAAFNSTNPSLLWDMSNAKILRCYSGALDTGTLVPGIVVDVVVLLAGAGDHEAARLDDCLLARRHRHALPQIVEAYDKDTVLEYLAFCQRQVVERVPQVNLEAASGFDWLPFSKLELQLYTIRHIQQHTGELMERLGARADVEINWVGMQHS